MAIIIHTHTSPHPAARTLLTHSSWLKAALRETVSKTSMRRKKAFWKLSNILLHPIFYFKRNSFNSPNYRVTNLLQFHKLINKPLWNFCLCQHTTALESVAGPCKQQLPVTDTSTWHPVALTKLSSKVRRGVGPGGDGWHHSNLPATVSFSTHPGTFACSTCCFLGWDGADGEGRTGRPLPYRRFSRCYLTSFLCDYLLPSVSFTIIWPLRLTRLLRGTCPRTRKPLTRPIVDPVHCGAVPFLSWYLAPNNGPKLEQYEWHHVRVGHPVPRCQVIIRPHIPCFRLQLFTAQQTFIRALPKRFYRKDKRDHRPSPIAHRRPPSLIIVNPRSAPHAQDERSCTHKKQ